MPRVLLVDDHEMNRELLRRRLQRAGYEVVSAGDGRQALSLAKQGRPDLVLMDLGLPDLDGWEVTRRLKADPVTRPVPVIALTAHTAPESRERAMQAGCDDFDTKPYDMPRLLGKIDALLKKRAAAATPPPAGKAPAPRPAEPTPTPRPPAPTGGGPVEVKRILVAEDHQANREMLCRRLMRQGYSVGEAADGAQALAQLRSGKYDLVLLDIMMPELDGYQVLEQAKADPATREVPVIMLSALDSIESIARCIELGAEDYLPKPYDPVI